MKRSTAGLVLSLVAAVGAGTLTTVVLVDATHTETITVSTHYLPPYTRIEPGDVKTIRVPIDIGMHGTVSMASEVVGKYLSFAVPAGYPITSASLNASDSYSNFLTKFSEQTGQPGVEMQLPVSSAIESLVQPGDSIALIVQMTDTSGSRGYQTIQPVKVLNVLQPAKGGSATALLIYVTEQNYQVLSQALLNNQVQVALVPQNGSFVTPASSGINLQSVPSPGTPQTSETQGGKNGAGH